MSTLRFRMTQAVARWYLRRHGSGGAGGRLDPALLSRLPQSVLMPLHRNGLNPVPELEEARAKGAVARLPRTFGLTAWLVTGYEEAKAVLADADSFSTDFANMIGGVPAAESSPGGLGFADPPVHTRLRKILTPEFTMRRLARLAPGIDQIIHDLLDAMAGKEVVDLVEDFALPIPSLVICDLLGVPYADRVGFQQQAMDRFDMAYGTSNAFAALSSSLDYLKGVVAAQRISPGDGLLGGIIRDHGDEIGDEELVGLADGVLTGGFETTASMLALGALALLQDEQAGARLREDDAAAHPFVEEVLRHLAVVQVAFPRFARRDVEVGGVRIGKGDVALISLSGANRDPLLGENLHEIDPTRTPVSHVTFGYGFHRCVGAELARMELRAAYPALVRAFPRMRLAVPPEELEFRKASIVYGLARLPVHPNADVPAREPEPV